MSDQTPQPRAQPPPLPPAAAPPPLPAARPLTYVMPGAQLRPSGGQTAQKVFDTVTGPNLRLKDNLIQLAVVIVGGGAGAVGGWMLAPTSRFAQAYLYVAVGAVLGLIVSVVVSGLIIGIVRGRDATRR